MTGDPILPPDKAGPNAFSAALAQGDRLRAGSDRVLAQRLAPHDPALVSAAVVAQVRGMIADLARQLAAGSDGAEDEGGRVQNLRCALVQQDALRRHCHALALEWRVAVRLEDAPGLDPVMSPILQQLVCGEGPAGGAMAMATLAAQARFAQEQRRSALPLHELPAELFDAALTIARRLAPIISTDADEARLRHAYDEGATRLAILSRLADEDLAARAPLPPVEEAGVALWLSLVAARSGEARETVIFAAASASTARLLLTLRAAGQSPSAAEEQVLRLHPDSAVLRGLHDVGTCEAAQWLASAPA